MKSRTEHQSKALPGAVFVIRLLNVIQRARRSAEIAGFRQEQVMALRTVDSLKKKLGIIGDEASQRAALDALDPEMVTKIQSAAQRAEDVYLGQIVPVMVKHGLAELRGVEVDGVPVTAAALLETEAEGLDELIIEIAQKCEEASQLSPEQEKNS